MANLKFARGTTTPTYSTSGFDDGCIYFNTSTQKIYMRNGTSSSSSTVEIYDGNNNSTNSRRITIGGSSFTYTSYDMCKIQSVPDEYSASATAGASSTSWYNTFGQGVVSASEVSNQSYDSGFDVAMSYYTSVPPLESAVKIVVAVSPFYMAYVGKGGTSMTNATYLPYQCIVECYRTTKSAYPYSEDITSTYNSNGPMFTGHYFAGVTGSGTYTGFGDIKLNLCCNGTNAIDARFYTCKAGSSTFSTSSLYCYSAAYCNLDSNYIYSSIEKYVYPIAIYY